MRAARLLLGALLLAGGAPAQTPSPVIVTWTAPTQNTDGSALTDLLTYTVLWGASPTALTQSQTVGVLTASIPAPTTGATTYVAVVTNDTVTGLSSAQTNVASVSGATVPVETLGAPTGVALTYMAGSGGGGGTGSGATEVNLAAIATLYAVANDGSRPPGGGADTSSDAYSETLLGSAVTWAGNTYAILPAAAPSAVANRLIPLPAGAYSTLTLLATAVNGNQTGQTFMITYTDSTTSTFQQSLSDWHTPQSYAGEAEAVQMAYRNEGGVNQAGPFYLYGYPFALTAGKSAVSLTLPANANVIVLALDLK